VITDSPEGKELKKWLYWENTYCLDGIRGKEGPGLRRYNGQVIAPVVMLWVGKDLKGYSDTREQEDRRIRDDVMVSATVAMMAAEELGLRTGFNGCLGEIDIAERLNLTSQNKKPIIAVGFGYAFSERRVSRDVYENNITITPYPNNDVKIHNDAYELIFENQNFIIHETIGWITHQVSNNIAPFVNYSYEPQKCRRDLVYIISAFLHDLQFNTTEATEQVISNYWIKGRLMVRGVAEKAAHNFIAELIKTYILKNTLATPYQSNYQQFLKPNNQLPDDSVELMDSLFLKIQKGLNGKILKVVGFDYANTVSSIKTGINRKNKPSLANMIKYI
jgi:hypothetical protein